MRKILVASQKGGVGKTTSSINLAALASKAGHRVGLIDADPSSSVQAALGLKPENGLPLETEDFGNLGTLYPQVLPRLDILIPSNAEADGDGNLDGLLASMSAWDWANRYHVLFVDSPPFLGTLPHLLLHFCQELILVMRSDPLSARTLPMYLQIVQQARQHAPNVALLGILLTLPWGTAPYGEWEQALRKSFPGCLFPQTIPFDESVGQGLLHAQPLVSYSPDSPAAQAYESLAETLGLIAATGRHA